MLQNVQNAKKTEEHLGTHMQAGNTIEKNPWKMVKIQDKNGQADLQHCCPVACIGVNTLSCQADTSHDEF
jgi:hypothetical protein